MLKREIMASFVCGAGLMLAASTLMSINNNPDSDKIIPSGHQNIEGKKQFASNHYCDTNQTVNDQTITGINKSAGKSTSSRTNQSIAKQSCDSTCRNTLRRKLKAGTSLTSEEAAAIRDNAHSIAKLLASSPLELANLAQSLQQNEENDNGTQAAAYAVLSALDNSQKTKIATQLLATSNQEHRVVGIQLLAPSINNDANAAYELGQILTRDTDPNVLTTAINVASRVDSSAATTQTIISSLTSVINGASPSSVKGSALLAKAKLVQSEQDVRDDVFRLLDSSSAQSQQFSLRAFSTIVERQARENTLENDWSEDAEFRETITSIANNVDADFGARLEAMQLMKQYF